jgi:hypothetical protein
VAFSIALGFSPDYWTKYPVDLPNDYRALIGEICQRWSWLEFQSGVLAREVLRLDKPAGYAITGGMSMRSVSTVLLALSLGTYLDKHPALKQRLNDLASKLYNIGDFATNMHMEFGGTENKAMDRLGVWKFKKPADRMAPNWVHKPVAALQADAPRFGRPANGCARLHLGLERKHCAVNPYHGRGPVRQPVILLARVKLDEPVLNHFWSNQ